MRRAGGLARGYGHGAATAAGRATRVLRAAVSAFFAGCFTSVAALLALPFSAAVLASEAMMAAPSLSETLVRGVAARLRAVFTAAGFPAHSPFFALLEAKLSQTVFTFAATLPFALTFLLLAKACVAAMLRDDDASSPRRRRRAPAVAGRGARVPGGGGDAPAQRVPHALRQRRGVLAAAAGVRRRGHAGHDLALLYAGALRRGRHRLLAGHRRGNRGVQPRRGRGGHGAPVRGARRGAQGVRGDLGAGVHGAGAGAAHQPRHGGRRGAVRAPRRRAAPEGREAHAGRRRRGLLDRVHPRDLRRAGDRSRLHVLPELQEE